MHNKFDKLKKSKEIQEEHENLWNNKFIKESNGLDEYRLFANQISSFLLGSKLKKAFKQ